MTDDPYPTSQRAGAAPWEQQPGTTGAEDDDPYPGHPAPAHSAHPAPYGTGHYAGAHPGHYAGAYPPGAQPRPDEMNWAGITSLVLALASPVISFAVTPLGLTPLGLIALVASIVLGIMGLIAAREGRATNRGIALAGLITAVVLIVLGILAVIALILVFGAFVSEISPPPY